MLKAVIFDMDGVIIDSEPMHAQAAIMALKQYNVELTLDYCYSFIGSTNFYMCQKIIEDYHIDATVEELHQANMDMKEKLLAQRGYSTIPYVIELMKNLYEHGIKLIIASSSPSATIEYVMDTLAIKQYFKGYISGMDIERPKPAPDIFLKAASSLGVSPDECLVIEDSPNGVNAAYAAGITCIGFMNPSSGKQNLKNAYLLLEGFDEVDYEFVSKVYRDSHQEHQTIIETDRLIIKELPVEDVETLYQLSLDTDIKKYLADLSDSIEIEKEKHKAYIQSVYQYYGYGLWGCYRKEDHTLVGRCGIELKSFNGIAEYELGYLIGKPYQGKGYALEAAKAVTQYFFDQYHASRIIAVIDNDNIPSLSLAEKLGMEKSEELSRNNRICSLYIINNL
ncbi:MAG TPA: GNAT family N-acetyltransferase [Mobilitalea sp.]|nr:GNAT family N-acetyltransferase [Mobilitalea sp.]